MDSVTSRRFPSFDGVELAVHRLGRGRPVVLFHGLFSSAEMNWIRFGHARSLADAGCEAIMPDLRGHGQSAAPRDPAAWPPDVLARDAQALVAHLGLADYDLGGFSLGARIAADAVCAGLSPRRLVLAGIGLEGLGDWRQRAAFFLDAIGRFERVKPGDPAFLAVQFMKTMNTDRAAARLLLRAIGDRGPLDLARLAMPVLVVCGRDDHDNGSPAALAAALPDARLALIAGTHMSSVRGPELGKAIAAFLAGPEAGGGTAGGTG